MGFFSFDDSVSALVAIFHYVLACLSPTQLDVDNPLTKNHKMKDRSLGSHSSTSNHPDIEELVCFVRTVDLRNNEIMSQSRGLFGVLASSRSRQMLLVLPRQSSSGGFYFMVWDIGRTSRREFIYGRIRTYSTQCCGFVHV